MDFVEFAIEGLDGEAVEVVCEIFNRYGYGGAVVEMPPPDFLRATVRTVIPADDEDLRQKVEIALALVSKALPQGMPPFKKRLVGKNDWAESWKEHFHVVRIGPRVVVQPSWRAHTPAPDDVVIHLDPGLAFGSGLHPTTKLCLEILQTMPLSGVDMFDVGTGSGILSIAAAKIGAGPVLAVDVDDVAVRVAEENFALNDLPTIQTAVGSAEASCGRQWSLVTANILSNILIEIMPNLKAALSNTGQLILSGIINEQEPPMLACLAEYGLRVQSRHVDGDWIALVVTR